MADRLTQLQDCFDQLATQMFASLRYISTHHSASPIPNQPFHGGAGEGADGAQIPVPQSNGVQLQNGNVPEASTERDSPDTFAAALTELSQDLVIKEQQIEVLVEALPGRSRSLEEQEEQMRRLNEELKDIDREVEQAGKRRAELLSKVESVIWKIHRY